MSIDSERAGTSRAAGGLLPSLVLSAAVALAAPGCFRHHTIEPGTWRLKIESEGSEGKRFVRKSRDVKVAVEWSKEEKGVEEMRISFASRNESQPTERVLAGKIEAGEISLDGYDQDWFLLLRGKVISPGSVRGTAFGRVRWDETQIFSGTWTMLRVEPE